jgi:hypothetical protein
MKYLFLFLLTFSSLNLFAQEYKKWEQNDVKGFYEKHQINLKNNEYIEIENDAIDKDGNSIYSSRIGYNDTYYGEFIYFTKIKVKSGQYEIEVNEKVNSKLWQVRGKNLYLHFRFNPFLFKWDEGVLEVSYNNGVFYKKP